ncbi:MAG: hypothetical protein GXP51_08585 [Deltaproteobacteria bacterium]|nr:hypothetical protein [Deltaproteobacteria bacterium]
MAGEQLLLPVVACLALLALLLGLRQLVVGHKLKREIDQLRAQFSGQLDNQAERPINFSASLDAVEREQLQTPTSSVPRNSAEKYRYIGALAEQGLAAEGIAEALQMPTAEVAQLLRLAKLKPAAPTK